MHYRKRLAFAALIAILSVPLSAHASFSGLYVFGDSLSDVGNVSNLTNGIPIAPYDNGYFSNGPTWVQTLGSLLGPDVGPTTASRLSGTNYAYGGARTGVDGDIFGLVIPSLVTQANTYVTDVGGAADANGLYVVWGGGNDVRDNESADSASNIASVISTLAAAGATNFLIPNLPNIGLTPESLAGLAPGGDSALMTALTLAHNTALVTQVAMLSAANPSLNIVLFDVFSIFNMLIDTPATFGFTNVDTACFAGALGVGGAGDVCPNPDQFVFWDGIHPTAAAHTVLGEMAAQVVPIPAALPLLLSGLAFLGFLGRRRQA